MMSLYEDRCRVDAFLDDIGLVAPERLALIEKVREVIFSVAPAASERVMYGGLMFFGPMPFCGIFSYARHVSLEFADGYALLDERGVLEGRGKFRRHIKLRALEEVSQKAVGAYVSEAVEKMAASTSF